MDERWAEMPDRTASVGVVRVSDEPFLPGAEHLTMQVIVVMNSLRANQDEVGRIVNALRDLGYPVEVTE